MRRLVPVLLLSGLLLGISACQGEERHPIIVASDRVTVINMTETAWTDVDVWLNDHYRAQTRTLAPGQRLDIPITRFIAGYGQFFNPKTQVPYGVQVDAKGADGKPVRLIWGKARWR